MRRDDWADRLFKYVEVCRARPMHAVEFNCVLFAAGAVKVMTDIDPVAMFGVEIKSERDVARVLVEHDGVRGLAAKFFGTDELLAPLQVRRGDVVIKDGVDGETLGICVGDHCLFVTDDGLQRRALLEVKGGWHVE